MKITVAFDKESFFKLNYRPFLAGMIAVVVMKIVVLMGVTIPFL